jgi:hypothetical protein
LAPTHEDRLKREIRDAIDLGPIVTIPELTDRLNKRLDHYFDLRYIRSLQDIVSRQLSIESDRIRIEYRMKSTRENHRIARDELLAILHSTALTHLYAARQSADTQRLEITGILGCAKNSATSLVLWCRSMM